MSALLQRLKYLPWRSLILTAILTVLAVALLELLLLAMVQHLPTVLPLLIVLFNPPLGLLVTLGAALGVGSLAVLILERQFQPVITAGGLWALVFCLAIAIFLRQLLPVPTLFLSFSGTQLILMMLGVFWKGRPYWR